MSALAALKDLGADAAERIFSPFIEAEQRRQREAEDAAAAANRVQLAQFDKVPKEFKVALAAKAKAESDHARAQATVSETRRVLADAEGVLMQRQYEHSQALRTLRRGAVAKYRTDAAFALLMNRADVMRASGITTAGEALTILVHAQQAVSACAAGDADPPADDFEAWLSDVFARADAAFSLAQRTAEQQREARARDERARKLMS